jgi:hypothetical protein
VLLSNKIQLLLPVLYLGVFPPGTSGRLLIPSLATTPQVYQQRLSLPAAT